MFKEIPLGHDGAEEWRYKDFKEFMLNTYENAKGIEALIKDGGIDDVLLNLASTHVYDSYNAIFEWYAKSSTIRMSYANDALKTMDFDDVWGLLKQGMQLYFEELYFDFLETLKEELGINQDEEDEEN